ncbi:12812_t:CDS:2, partial [Racocetra persica]
QMLQRSYILPVAGTIPQSTFRNLSRRLFKTILWTLVLGYFSFSVILSSIHLFEHLRGKSRKALQPINRMYNGIFPFYFRAELTPEEDDITVTTLVTKD